MASSGRFERFVDWLDERYDVRLHLLDRVRAARFPSGSPWGYRFGLFALLGLAIQFASGLLLLLEYVPTVDGAQPSLRRIVAEIPFGWYVRAVHVLGASLAVGSGALYLLSVVLSGLYRRPRELNWVVLTLAFGVLFWMAYTGSVLPWDERSLSAASVGHDLAGRTPVVGPRLADLVFGGADPSAATLRRALAFHLVLGPALLAILVRVYLSFVRSTGHERVGE